LHPFPGVPYIYSLDGAVTGAEPAKNFTWWATKNTSFITGVVDPSDMSGSNFAGRLTTTSGDLIDAGTTYGVTTAATTTGANEVEITWSADILAGTTYQGDGVAPNGTPTFVVGYAEGDNCADNIEVYEINPLKNFTIDIASIDTALATPTQDWDVPTEQCVDVIQSATYTANELLMDYGKNNFYFEVAAANFVKNFNPVFTIISGLENGQEAIITLYPTYAAALAGGATTITGGTSPVLTDANVGVGVGWDPDVDLAATTPSDAATGVSVFVRVTVYNNTWESLAVNPFELAVDARDNDDAGIWDMEDEDCAGDPALNLADQVDSAIHNINPRPTLEHNTTDTNATAPNDVIEKTQP
jgi:hypothetical protein